jgi:hypothetical protein
LTLELLGMLQLQMRKAVLDIQLLMRVKRSGLLLLKRCSHILLIVLILEILRMDMRGLVRERGMLLLLLLQEQLLLLES